MEITVIVCLAAVLAIFFRIFKQSPILAYILTGIIIGYFGFFPAGDREVLQTLAELGITLLLFMLGLEIKIRDFSSVGKLAVVIGLGQMVSSFALGFLLSVVLGFSSLSAMYIAVALSFSSTVFVVKLLSDKKDLHSLYAKISIGILLIQDLLAILVLIFLSTLDVGQAQAFDIGEIGMAIVKAIILFGVIIFLSKNIFPKFMELFSKSSEVLFLVSIAWVFGLAAFISSPWIGFSVEIGGLLAGLALSNSLVNYQIIARAKVLRDFFIILFFVLLGVRMTFENFGSIWFAVLVMSFLVLILKPLSVMILAGLMGFRKRTSFLSGISLAQVSEFSLVIVFLGQKVGHISGDVASLITLVSIITFAVSTYMIDEGNKFYLHLGRYIFPFERQSAKNDEIVQSDKFTDLKNHVVIIGGDQMGQSVIDALTELENEIVVVDFDPAIVKKLANRKIHRLFGDITDLEIQDKAQLNMARLVISTIPDIEDNTLLIKELNKENRRAKIIVMSFDVIEAKKLYKEGADYVVLPHLAGGRQLAKILEKDLDDLAALKARDQQYL